MRMLTRFTRGIFLLAAVGASLSIGFAQEKMRWDITSVQFSEGRPNVVSPGGFASAWQLDPGYMGRWKITMTGTGTFSSWDPSDVSGGGTWRIQRLTTAGQYEEVSRGTFTVTALVSWALDSPQLLSVINKVTNTTAEDFRNGMGVFRIAYSDGSKGALMISCAGPGASNQVYEGISAIKGQLHFAWPELPAPGTVDANRNIFTVLR